MNLNPIRETTLVLIALLAGSVQAQSTLYDLPGSMTGDRYGHALRSAGDVDGDGTLDFIVGTGAGVGGQGYARVVSGANGQTLHTFVSSVAGDWFGTAVAGAGDVNADGHAELLVGAPLAGAGGSGQAMLYDGDSGALIYTLTGVSPGDHFGWSLAGLGDVDGDLFPDFAVGAIDDDNLASSAGTVRVVSGATGAELYTLEGTRTNELFGYALAGLPDIDGDGRGELVVGAPFTPDPKNTQPGDASVFSGATGALLLPFSGWNARDTFGSAVAHAGDVDGDGIADVGVGAPQPIAGKSGYALVFSGQDGAVLLDWGGDSAGDLFGSALASAGDLNGDGRSEVAVGAPGDDDTGSAAGAVRVFDGASALTIFTRFGTQAGEEFGASLDAAGDLNGDAMVDLLASGPGQGAGSARAQSNVALGLASHDHLLPIGGPGGMPLDLDFGPSSAGRTFLVFGSISGISQGTPFGGLTLSINRDRYFKKTYGLGPNGTLQPPTGNLDAAGTAVVNFTPPGSSSAKWLVGQTFHHVAVVLDAQGNTVAASNAWPITIVP